MSQRKKRRHHNRSQSTRRNRGGGGRRTSARRRRANPPGAGLMRVVVANPHKGLRSSRKRRRANGSALRRATSHRVSARSRRRGNADGAAMRRRSNGHRRLSMRRRHRANPVMGFSLGTIVRVGAFGAAGIISVRIFGALYTQYISEYVRGDEGQADPTSWRNTLDEIVRLVVMELGAFAVDRALLKNVKARPSDRIAYLIGASAEVGRQAVGVALHAVSPTTDRKAWGLDGLYDGGQPPQAYEHNGRIYVLNDAGTGYEDVTDHPALDGLAFRDSFPSAGMAGDVMRRDAFRHAGFAS